MPDEAPQKKRMGRPPKSPEKGRRQNYTFRMSDADRDKVVAAAEAAGRSISEEIERRIEDSFKTVSTADYRTRALLDNIIQLIARMEKAAGNKWWEDEITAELCGEPIRNLIDLVMPKRSLPKNMLLELTESDQSRREREAKEAAWESALRMDLMDRAIAIFQGEPGSPDYIKANDKLSQPEKSSGTK